MNLRRLRTTLLIALLALGLYACGGPARNDTAAADPTPAAEEAAPSDELATPADEAAEPTAMPTPEPSAPTRVPAAIPAQKDIYAVGDTAWLEPMLVTLGRVDTTDTIDAGAAREGYQFVQLGVTFENAGAERQDVALLLQTLLEDADGKPYAIDAGASLDAVMTLNGAIDAGERATGTIGFQVPKDAKALHFVFRTLDAAKTGEAGRVMFELGR